MKRSSIPFNIKILELTPQKLSALKPVRSLNIFDSTNTAFDEDGLFSTSIFGKVGNRLRNQRFSYVDIKIPIFHPAIYNALVDLKKLYAGIIDGSEYVLWDDKINDFVRSDVISGKTGYHYFVTHWKKIQFEKNKSISREQNILLVAKYMSVALTDKILIIPAGLRDLERGEDGRIEEDEINTPYRRLLSIANTVTDSAVKNNPEISNTSRFQLQRTFNDIYEMLRSLLEGKKKLVLGKWASRNIQNGTRNVITAMNTAPTYLGADGAVQFNDTMIGLYQTMKSVLPKTLFFLRTGFLSNVFVSPGAPALLVNKKTLKSERVQLKPSYFERYMTDEGLEKVITAFGEEDMRDRPLEIDGRYMGLVYKGPDGTFKLIHDVDQVPSSRNKEDVHPMTFCELMYLSGYRDWNKFPLLATRYPITGVGSIYPSRIFLKTTLKSEVRKELNDQWELQDKSYTAYEFPTKGPYFNSMSPHSSHLDRATADFDGDMMSGNAIYTDDAVEENEEFFRKRSSYIGVDGKFTYSTNVSTVALVMFNMTGD